MRLCINVTSRELKPGGAREAIGAYWMWLRSQKAQEVQLRGQGAGGSTPVEASSKRGLSPHLRLQQPEPLPAVTMYETGEPAMCPVQLTTSGIAVHHHWMHCCTIISHEVQWYRLAKIVLALWMHCWDQREAP